MFRWLAALFVVILPGATFATDWLEEDYNPVPLEGDILLPMPCDGRMVFRKVETNLINGIDSGLYADRAVRLGWDGARASAYREGEWKSYVAGGLIDDTARYYLIGKYELTNDQVNALVSGDCDDTDVEFGLPITGLTWFDAIHISHLYSVWLHTEAPDVLPVSAGTSAYVRPPTEAEWEFAARGGLEVTDSERRNQRFPIETTLGDYAFFAGDGVSNGELQYIGKKAPNPLGLFDVYGNAFEIVFDPFRLNKRGRMHGHFGALTIIGGSIRSSQDETHSGSRQEVPLYSADVPGAVTRRADVGLRLVISGVSTGDQQYSDILSRNWGAADDTNAINLEQPPVQLLRQLADESTDIALRDRLNDIAGDIENNLRERDELEVAALENLLQSGTLMIYRIRGLYKSIENMRGLRAHLENRSPDPQPGEQDHEMRARLRLVTQYDDNIADFRRFASIYADTFLQLTEDYPRAQVLDVARSLVGELRLQGRNQIADHLTVLGVHLRDFDNTAGWNRADEVLTMMQLADRFTGTPTWFEGAINQN